MGFKIKVPKIKKPKIKAPKTPFAPAPKKKKNKGSTNILGNIKLPVGGKSNTAGKTTAKLGDVGKLFGGIGASLGGKDGKGLFSGLPGLGGGLFSGKGGMGLGKGLLNFDKNKAILIALIIGAAIVTIIIVVILYKAFTHDNTKEMISMVPVMAEQMGSGMGSAGGMMM